jgi:hypothetical protein
MGDALEFGVREREGGEGERIRGVRVYVSSAGGRAGFREGMEEGDGDEVGAEEASRRARTPHRMAVVS